MKGQLNSLTNNNVKEQNLSNAVVSRLQQFGIRPKHHLGQNFLVDELVYDAILRDAQLSKKISVIEIGTGLGTLTERLADQANKVITIENDFSLIKKLPQVLSQHKNVTLVPGNVLDIPNGELLRLLPAKSSYKVVANIPYYITGKIIQKFLRGDSLPTEIILMVQREVAERISAPTGKTSMLSVVAQSLAKVELLFPVSSTSFFPEPKVQSAVIRLIPYKTPKDRDQLEIMFKVAKMSFAHRRKKLSNGLSSSLQRKPKEIDDVLAGISVDAQARPQELSLEQWMGLTKTLLTRNWISG